MAAAAAVRAVRWSVTASLFNDGPTFLGIAGRFAVGDVAGALDANQHPLYPALVSLLLPLFLVPLPPTSSVGLGSISAPISGAVSGATVFTQIWTLTGQNPATLEVSNIHSASFP